MPVTKKSVMIIVKRRASDGEAPSGQYAGCPSPGQTVDEGEESGQTRAPYSDTIGCHQIKQVHRDHRARVPEDRADSSQDSEACDYNTDVLLTI